MPTSRDTSDHRIDPWVDRWSLTLDGEAFDSLAGRLVPVRCQGRRAMLKVSHAPEEVRGARVMQWWGADGAAEVLAREGEALLLERACGAGDLVRMARTGRDDEATEILCAAAARLHGPRPGPQPDSLVALDIWYSALWSTAEANGGDFATSAAIARGLLAKPQDVRVLHGDLHHGNVLDFGARGWLAIDPKGLIGERGFDYANMLCNPDVAIATAPGRFERQLALAARCANLDEGRLLRWVVAYLGLSASWTLGGGGDPRPALAILRVAMACMQR